MKFWSVVSVCGLCMMASACSQVEVQSATAVVVAVYIDPLLLTQVSSIETEVLDESGKERADLHTFKLTASTPQPLSFGIAAGGAEWFMLATRGLAANGTVLVEHKVIAQFERGKTGLLAVTLRGGCLGVSCEGEDAGKTCYAEAGAATGRCVYIEKLMDLPTDTDDPNNDIRPSPASVSEGGIPVKTDGGPSEPAPEAPDAGPNMDSGTSDSGVPDGPDAGSDGGTVGQGPCGAVGQRCCAQDKCGDDNACNGEETCVAGMCKAGEALTCADDNDCTRDLCTPKVGCEFPAVTLGSDCDDGDGCTQTDSCQGKVCVGGNPLQCEGAKPLCKLGECVAPPSCKGLEKNCGPSFASSCCEPIQVPGGSYLRTFDKVYHTDQGYPAMVTSFALDALEVTVGRFRAFVASGNGHQEAPPATGSGAIPGVNRTGWKASFNESLASDKATLVKGLNCDVPFGMWTDLPGANENRPINCVTWYEAFAFCIWDGGRLPTEAEWNFAAASGSEQRVYPWSTDANPTTITSGHASYWLDGTKLCFGDGANGCSPRDILVAGRKSGSTPRGHADMAGNLREWVFDYYAETYPTPCADCAQVEASPYRVLRGGAYTGDYVAVSAGERDYASPLERVSISGFRCAYRQ